MPPGKTEAFSRAEIDAQLTDVGWKLTDGRNVHFEYTLSDRTGADYVLATRVGPSMAVVDAIRILVIPVKPEYP